MSNLPDRRGPEPRQSRWGDRSYEDTHDRSRALGWRVYVPRQVTHPNTGVHPAMWTFIGPVAVSMEELVALSEQWDMDLDHKRKAVHVYGRLPGGLVSGVEPMALLSRKELGSGSV